ncbi:MAG: hypothetical protein HYX34_01460 [Actinobacteria bacterium]|nr:hypothetical protein [Actinomycetota bacterium]
MPATHTHLPAVPSRTTVPVGTRAVAVAVAVVASLAAAACGAAGRVGTTSGDGDPGGWRTIPLGVRDRGDMSVVMGAVCGAVNVVAAGATLDAFEIAGGAALRVPIGRPAGTRLWMLGTGLAEGPGGPVVAGIAFPDEGNGESRGVVWRLEGERGWQPTELPAGPQQVDVSAVAATPTGYVVVGSQGTSPFVPVAWRSTDGVAWSRVALPSSPEEVERLAGLAAVGDAVVAVGQARRDGGSAGVAVRIEPASGAVERLGAGGPPLSGVARTAGGRVVATIARDVTGATTVLATSDDSGRSWTPVDAGTVGLTRAGTAVRPSQIVAGEGLVAAAAASPGPQDDPGCWVDLAACREESQRASRAAAYVSTDATAWSAVDLPGDDGIIDVSTAVWPKAGLSVAGWIGGTLNVWQRTTSGDAGPLPTQPPATTTSVPALPPPLGVDEVPVVGRTYRIVVFDHCGIEQLGVAAPGGRSRRWAAASGQDLAAATKDPSWPYELVVRTASDRVELRNRSGTVLARYDLSAGPGLMCA